MAKKKAKRGGKLTRAEIKRAGGIKQAWAARKAGKRHTKSTRKASRGSKRHGRKSGSRRRASRPRTRKVKSTVVRRLPAHTTQIVVTPVPSKGRSKRRGKKRKSGGKKRRKARKGTSKRRGRKAAARKAARTRKEEHAKRSRSARKAARTRRRGRTHTRISPYRKYRKNSGRPRFGKKHRTTAKEHYAMENPLMGVEIFVGALTGALGFAASDVLDRFLATHALTGNAGAYTDTPPSSTTTTWMNMGYQGLYNGTAVVAPMNVTRWGAGLALGLIPIGLAHFVSAPVGRSALQMFGFGAIIRTLGKGFQDLFSMLTAQTSFGQQLYDNELRAQMLATQQTGGTYSGPTLPTTGLGAAACNGCGAPASTVAAGLGACCSACKTMSSPGSQLQQPPIVPAPPPPPPPMQNVPIYNGGGERPPVRQQLPPASNVPVGTPVTSSAGQFAGSVLQGLEGVPRKRSIYDWGHDGNSD